jgi:hypothetical protein
MIFPGIALLDPYWSRQMPLLNPQDYLPLLLGPKSSKASKAFKLLTIHEL